MAQRVLRLGVSVFGGDALAQQALGVLVHLAQHDAIVGPDQSLTQRLSRVAARPPGRVLLRGAFRIVVRFSVPVQKLNEAKFLLLLLNSNLLLIIYYSTSQDTSIHFSW